MQSYLLLMPPCIVSSLVSLSVSLSLSVPLSVSPSLSVSRVLPQYFVAEQVQQVRNKLDLFRAGLAKQTRAMDVFERLFRAPPAYSAFLIERDRRYQYHRTVAAATASFAQAMCVPQQSLLPLPVMLPFICQTFSQGSLP